MKPTIKPKRTPGMLDVRAEPWYRQIVGSYADDKAFAEIIRLGRLIRAGKKPK
jgi:hypothetical protein